MSRQKIRHKNKYNKKQVNLKKPPKSTIKPKKNNSKVSFLNPIFGYGTQQKIIPSTGAGLVDDWWTRNRDKQLEQIVKQSDYMAIALINIAYKIFGIEPVVKLTDNERGQTDNDKDLIKFYQTLIKNNWLATAIKLVYNTIIFDNGVFIEIIGNSGGSSNSQIKPSVLNDGTEIPATGFSVLDTLRCTRTGDDTYPVLYKSIDGKQYKLHKSRIFSFADMPSANPAMYGVGFSAVSRVLQNLTQTKATDDLIYSMLYDGDVGRIIQLWEKDRDGEEVTEQLHKLMETVKQKNTDFSKGIGTKSILIGSGSEEPPQMLEILLQKLPEGFKKREMVEDIMTLIAFAIGMDVREIFHVKGGGATKADTEITDKKGNKKFITWFLTTIENFINNHILPDWLSVNFDSIDEDAKKVKAEARKLLTETHKLELENGTITKEIAIQQLFEEGHYTEAQKDAILEEIETIGVNNQVQPGIVRNNPNNLNNNQNESTQNGLFRDETKEAEPGQVLITADGFVVTTGDIDKAKEEAIGTQIGSLIGT